MSKEERQRIYEYAMDRKNGEIKALEQKIIEMEQERERHIANVVIAEICLFLLGIFIGALFMKSYGWRLL